MFTGFSESGHSAVKSSFKFLALLIGMLGFLYVFASITPSYAADGDQDDDGIADDLDNCVYVANEYQEDGDADGVGDLCDNCPEVPNEFQDDNDYDNVGDACDQESGSCDDFYDNDGDFYYDCGDPDCFDDPVCIDTDGDFVPDIYDNCIDVANENQEDSDGDGVGDACQDGDGDGVPDIQDNCPLQPNEDQADTDFDGVGNACDLSESRCNNGVSDDDDDLIDCDDPDCAHAQVCLPAPDSDGDGVPNKFDNCPKDDNADQADNDGDGAGNVCDGSPDGGTEDPEDSNIADTSVGGGSGCGLVPGSRPPGPQSFSALLAATAFGLVWRIREQRKFALSKRNKRRA